MTTFFGPRWNAPIVQGATQVPTPLGARCYDCDEAVELGDRGFLRVGGKMVDGLLVAEGLVVHAECEMRMVMGHMVGVCRCTGYQPGRETAQLVWQRVYGTERE